jgi:hypothetical protein
MIGLYAALAFAGGERTREIAYTWRSAPRAPTSAASSFVAAWRSCRWAPPPASRRVIAGPFLAHLLYGVSPRDPLAIIAGPSVLIVVAALAISLPARRAMHQNPIIALRAE